MQDTELVDIGSRIFFFNRMQLPCVLETALCIMHASWFLLSVFCHIRGWPG